MPLPPRPPPFAGTGARTWTVLYVCTGNICRSPMAERLTLAGLARRLDTDPAAAGARVGSAGTQGWAGSPMESGALHALAARSVAAADFRGSALSPALLVGADLVLGLTRAHRAAAVTLHPPASRRTFTLREFARLTDGLAFDPPPAAAGLPARGRALVAAAGARRGLLPPVPAAADDVDDPIGQPDAVFAACADLLSAALAGWLDLLVPA